MTTTDTSTRPACSDAPDPDAFFPRNGEVHGQKPPARALHLTRTYCAFCPIRPACELEGDTAKRPGLWGGYWRRRSHTYGYVKTLAV